MKTLGFLVPILFVISVLLVVTALPTSAQGPAPTPTGETYLDPLNPPCDWVGIDPATPQDVSTRFYKVPYTRGTYLLIYAWSTLTNEGFNFDVYDAYNATLFNIPDDQSLVTWDNWEADKAGSGGKPRFEPWDLEWMGKGNNGTADSFFLVQVRNQNPVPVWYKLCYMNK